MTRQVSYSAAAVAALSLVAASPRFHDTVQASGYQHERQAPPVVFQASGPTGASIQSMVDAFRAALGGANNGNAPGPLTEGRREINWDGGGSTDTSIVPTPFDGFLITRGGRFTTPGSGFVQAPVEGLATTFYNPTYAHIFQAFSPVRLFSPIDRNVTNARFFVPGGGELPATTSGFGAVFSDVDETDETTMSFYDIYGKLLYSTGVPGSKGDANLSFVGVRFDDARIAYVRIRTGNVAPGPNDRSKRDVVMMDDFLYGEPQAIDAQRIQDTGLLQDLTGLENN